MRRNAIAPAALQRSPHVLIAGGSYHPSTWTPFDTVTKASDEASDHHLVWADLDL
jgi:hypothetical protein